MTLHLPVNGLSLCKPNGHSATHNPTHLFTEASVVLHDAVVHVSSISQLQDEVELGGRVDDLIEAHHVGVLHHLHAAHLLEKVTPCHRVQLSLIYHLHSNLEEQHNQRKKLNKVMMDISPIYNHQQQRLHTVDVVNARALKQLIADV